MTNTSPLYVAPEQRPYFLLLWQGVPHRQATARVGVSDNTARQWRWRLREAAGVWAGGEVNDCYALRLLFAPASMSPIDGDTV